MLQLVHRNTKLHVSAPITTGRRTDQDMLVTHKRIKRHSLLLFSIIGQLAACHVLCGKPTRLSAYIPTFSKIATAVRRAHGPQPDLCQKLASHEKTSIHI